MKRAKKSFLFFCVHPKNYFSHIFLSLILSIRFYNMERHKSNKLYERNPFFALNIIKIISGSRRNEMK